MSTKPYYVLVAFIFLQISPSIPDFPNGTKALTEVKLESVLPQKAGMVKHILISC
jgi:hypothetical protein